MFRHAFLLWQGVFICLGLLPSFRNHIGPSRLRSAASRDRAIDMASRGGRGGDKRGRASVKAQPPIGVPDAAENPDDDRENGSDPSEQPDQ
eukprot:3975295-Pyramimonas_sp.AAC.1